MRDVHVGTISIVLSLAALLAACAGDPSGPGGPSEPLNPFAPGSPPPPRPSLFVSPFGEPFVAEPGQPYPSAEWFAGADADRDGAVTLTEFTADGLRFFASLDGDRDGRLNQTELAAYEETLRRFGGRLMGRGGGPHARGHAINSPGPAGDSAEIPLARSAALDTPTLDPSTLGAAPQSQPGSRRGRSRGGRAQGYGAIAESGFFNLPQPVKSADVNVDQRVSAEEWAQATQRWFWSLDTDRDGKLTLATLPVTPAQAAINRRR